MAHGHWHSQCMRALAAHAYTGTHRHTPTYTDTRQHALARTHASTHRSTPVHACTCQLGHTGPCTGVALTHHHARLCTGMALAWHWAWGCCRVCNGVSTCKRASCEGVKGSFLRASAVGCFVELVFTVLQSTPDLRTGFAFMTQVYAATVFPSLLSHLQQASIPS